MDFFPHLIHVCIHWTWKVCLHLFNLYTFAIEAGIYKLTRHIAHTAMLSPAILIGCNRDLAQ